MFARAAAAREDEDVAGAAARDHARHARDDGRFIFIWLANVSPSFNLIDSLSSAMHTEQNDRHLDRLDNADLLELALEQMKTAAASATTTVVDGKRLPLPLTTTTDDDRPQCSDSTTRSFQAGYGHCMVESLKYLDEQHRRTSVDTVDTIKATPPPATMADISPAQNSASSIAPMDLCVRSADRSDSAVKQPHPVQLPAVGRNSLPARPDVLMKIRRQIFERRGRGPSQWLHSQEHRHQHGRDDGYDSDETLFMWRPW